MRPSLLFDRGLLACNSVRPTGLAAWGVPWWQLGLGDFLYRKNSGSLPQPYARPLAVGIDEDDAGGLERVADGAQVGRHRLMLTLLEADDGAQADAGFARKMHLRHSQKTARGPALIR